MSNPIPDSTARMEQLLRKIMKELDPAKYDDLCSQLWNVLHEPHPRLGQSSFPEE